MHQKTRHRRSATTAVVVMVGVDFVGDSRLMVVFVVVLELLLFRC